MSDESVTMPSPSSAERAKKPRRSSAKRKRKVDARALGTQPVGQRSKPSRKGVGSQFKEEFIRLGAGMAKLGATDRQMAELFEVTETTLNNWKLQHPKFAAALKIGKNVPDQMAERTLLNRALGYSFDSEELFVDKFGVEHRMPTVKHVPPDVTALIFWLKNRRPHVWRDRLEHALFTPTTPENIRLARERAGILQDKKSKRGAVNPFFIIPKQALLEYRPISADDRIIPPDPGSPVQEN